jgi:iron-sulfur cluster assembly accessory protein
MTLTPRAADAIRERAAQADVPGHPLRIAVVGGGCNGLTYDLYFVEEPGSGDEVIETCGLRVVVDAASGRLLDGAEIDLHGESFVFHNPRARKTCSCGASFEV